MFTEDLLCVKYSTNCKLPTCEWKEGRNYYHFYLSFYSSEKRRLKEVQLPAQGHLDSKKQGLDTDSSPLSSIVPASLMATALGQERWWGRAGWGREEGNGMGCSWIGNQHHQGWLVPHGGESSVRGPGRSFSVLRCDGFLTWMKLIPWVSWPGWNSEMRCEVKETRHERPYTIWFPLYEMFRRDESIERWIYSDRMYISSCQGLGGGTEINYK